MTSQVVHFRTNKIQSSDNTLLEDAPIKEKVIAALRTVYDPEIPVNLYDLGLIYEITINDEHEVHIIMTLTAPGCPVAGVLPKQVKNAVRGIEEIIDVRVDIVWDPPWTQANMSDEARLELGMF